ncbi:unnamed protein product [Prunus brigantina]
MPHTIILKDQYQQAPSSKASTLLPLRGIQNFVVPHFQISVDQIRTWMQITKKKQRRGQWHHQLPWFYIFFVLGFIVGFWGVCGSLIIIKTWRYAYFRFIDNLQDKVYVMVTVRINLMKKRLRG